MHRELDITPTQHISVRFGLEDMFNEQLLLDSLNRVAKEIVEYIPESTLDINVSNAYDFGSFPFIDRTIIDKKNLLIIEDNSKPVYRNANFISGSSEMGEDTQLLGADNLLAVAYQEQFVVSVKFSIYANSDSDFEQVVSLIQHAVKNADITGTSVLSVYRDIVEPGEYDNVDLLDFLPENGDRPTQYPLRTEPKSTSKNASAKKFGFLSDSEKVVLATMDDWLSNSFNFGETVLFYKNKETRQSDMTNAILVNGVRVSFVTSLNVLRGVDVPNLIACEGEVVWFVEQFDVDGVLNHQINRFIALRNKYELEDLWSTYESFPSSAKFGDRFGSHLHELLKYCNTGYLSYYFYELLSIEREITVEGDVYFDVFAVSDEEDFTVFRGKYESLKEYIKYISELDAEDFSVEGLMLEAKSMRCDIESFEDDVIYKTQM